MTSRRVVEIDRDDAALVYRFLRDHGAATLVQITENCFPLAFGSADPLYRRLLKRGVSRTLASIEWMRRQGVDLSCVSVPGYPSEYSLGWVRQGVENIGSVSRHIDLSGAVTATGVSDFMGAWHGD